MNVETGLRRAFAAILLVMALAVLGNCARGREGAGGPRLKSQVKVPS